MQLNRGRPKTGINYKRITLSYPKELELILKQVKQWDSKVNFSREFAKTIRRVHKKLARQR